MTEAADPPSARGPDAPATRPEPGSFRDPASRVYYADDRIYRALSPDGLEDFQALAASGLLADGRVVSTVRADGAPATTGLPGGVAAVLEHERIPFVSYPYEWTFSMLKDAALLQLDLVLDAVDHGLMLKDASPYNVQFVGGRAVFIDVGSFERLREDELWVGYRQFCMLYLYPLLLQATKGVAFQPWLRGSLEGIDPRDMRGLMSFRDRFRRGFPTNVFLHARLAGRDGDGPAGMRSELRRPGFGKQLIVANVQKMRRFVERIDWRPPQGVWVGYGDHNTYTEGDARQKDEFLRRVANSRRRPLVWDIGCNNGRHSRIAAEAGSQVVAIDADPGPVDLLYRDLRDARDTRILPLTMNAADPSPGLGWRGVERMTITQRGRPDLILALALVHHVAITANVPVREVVDWLATLGDALVVEFPTREDPMVQKLLAPKRPGLHADYEQAFFERCLYEAFDVHGREELGSGTRILYFATPKGRTASGG